MSYKIDFEGPEYKLTKSSQLISYEPVNEYAVDLHMKYVLVRPKK